MTRTNKACFSWISILQSLEAQEAAGSTWSYPRCWSVCKGFPGFLLPAEFIHNLSFNDDLFPLYLATHFHPTYRSPVIPQSFNTNRFSLISAWFITHQQYFLHSVYFRRKSNKRTWLNISSLSWSTCSITIAMQTACPKRLQNLHPLRYSKLGWRRSWTKWFEFKAGSNFKGSATLEHIGCTRWAPTYLLI